MHNEQRERAHQKLTAHGIDYALFANIHSTKWLTGFVPFVELGQSPFAGGASLVWYAQGEFTFIALDAFTESAAGFGAQSGCTVKPYGGYSYEAPLNGVGNFIEVVRETLNAHDLNGKNIGVELNDVTVNLFTLLQQAGGENITAIDGWLEPLRAVKTAEEIQKLRDNFRLTDIGHAAARQAVKVGATEMDVYTAVQTAIQKAAGKRVPIGNDFIVGHREQNIGGAPLNYEIKPNDSFIVDISTLLHGYWSDSCATYYASPLTAQQIAMHDTAANALAYGISLLKPGAIAREIDQKIRQFIIDAGYEAYPHHSGHGVGVIGHEAPRITPYNDEVLQENMIVMLEPGIYDYGKTSVRLEHAMLITADGAEQLTQHDIGY